jgi:two-component system, cell cycle sensor histidine kinase and response regulator CckA
MAAKQQLQDDSRAAQLDAARLELARLHASAGQSLREVWVKLAELASQALCVERVGVWTLIDEGRALRCRYLLQRSDHEMFQGAVLRQQDFPAYFAAMNERRAIVADDASGSAITHQMRDAYLEPLGIASMLDAPIYLHGGIVGIVCHEHIGATRTWTEAECGFAGAVADNIARLYGEHERHHAETAIQAYQRHLMELNRMEAVGRMAAGIAHDFRGIVGAALGFAELIRRVPDLPEQADEYAQRVIDALDRGRRLTQQVMQFGKDDPVSPRVLDAAAVIENISTMLRMLLGKDIQLILDIDRAVSRVFIDSAQLERALLNLVLNSRDAMPHGGEIKIQLEDAVVEEEGDPATYVAISVIDSGGGMDAETQSKVFEPFFTTKGEHGTGLGLVIVDQIVARCGGRVSLDSEIGRGTRVNLYLPRIAAPATRTMTI